MGAGDLADLIAVFNDVTARLTATHESLRAEVTRLEEELRGTKRQLERSRELAALGEMAAGIAHEVRNPLGSIKLDAGMLMEELSDRPEARSVAARIAQAVDRLNGVVGDVLAFSRTMRVRRESVHAVELLEQARDACADLIAEFGIDVRIEHARGMQGCGGLVTCDRGLMHQALVNVIRNACQALGEDTAAGQEGESGTERVLRLKVQRRRVLAGAEHAHRISMMSWVVRDNGPGIPADALTRVFNPFYTTRHTGTGLGLAIVHRIVDAHGGRVEIRRNCDTDGEPGTTVELLVPVAGQGAPGVSDARSEDTRSQHQGL